MPISGNKLSTFLLLITLSLCSSQLIAANEAGEEESDKSDEQAIIEQIERASLPSRYEQRQLQLQQQYPEQYIQLDSETAKASALFIAAERAEPLGTVLLIPSPGQSADDAENISPLRNLVTTMGWNSLSLELPEANFAALRIEGKSLVHLENAQETAPEQTEPDEDSNKAPQETSEQEQTNTPPPLDEGEITASQDEQVFYTLAASINFLHNKNNGKLIIMAQREAAYWLLEFIQNTPTISPDAIVLITPQQPAQAKHSLAQLLPKLEIPIQDYFFNHNSEQLALGAQRLSQAKRMQLKHYQQVVLQEPVQLRRNKLIQTRIKGWLHHYQTTVESKAK